MHPLDVGVVAPNIRRRDGQGRIILEIVRRLVERGHNVTAYSSSLDEELISHPRLDWRRVDLPKGPSLLGIFTFPMKATFALRGTRHDVVCTMGPCALSDRPVAYYAPFTQLGWRAAWRTVGKPDLLRKLAAHASSVVERRAVPRARAVLGMSEQILMELAPLTSPTARVRVAPGGVDLDEFPPVTEDERRLQREALGISPDSFAIALIGEFATGRKGLDHLAKAVAMTEDEKEIIVVRGEGPAARVAERMDKIGLEGRVIMAGAGPAREVIAAADLVAIPSTYEPFSLVALEAAASEVPLIISKFAGASEVLEGASVSVDPVDAREVRRAIDQVKSDPKGAKAMAVAARRVAEQHTWTEVSDLVVDEIELLQKV